MKKLITVCALVLISFQGLSTPQKGLRTDSVVDKSPKSQKSLYDVIPLNSPVKGTIARFLIKTPANFEINQVKFKVKSAWKLFLKEKDYSPLNLINSTQGKELQIPISGLSNGFYRLYVRVRTEEKSKKNYLEHDYKKANRDYVRFVIEKGPIEVPQPDPVQNNATIGGIDSDDDGIRDDVQIWINNEFKDNQLAKQGAQQFARARQLEITNATVKELSVIASRKLLQSNECLTFLLGFDEKVRIRRKVDERILNTKARLYAESKTDSNFSGQSYSLASTPEEENALCDFESRTP